MKKIILLLIVFIGINAFSQNKESFKPGVKLIEGQKIENYKNPNSILFVFKGHSHSINFFLDLEKKIRKKFKKNKKKGGKIELNFNYNLSTQNSLKHDLEKIPMKKYDRKEYESICHISISDIKGWDHHLLKKRKQSYTLDVELKDVNLSALKTFKLNVNSYYTILTQNKKSSSLMYQTLLEN